jgi:hypothetical protein
MKLKLRKKPPIIIATVITSIFTIVFAAISIIYSNTFVFRILAQVCASLTMMFSGANSYFFLKRKW